MATAQKSGTRGKGRKIGEKERQAIDQRNRRAGKLVTGHERAGKPEGQDISLEQVAQTAEAGATPQSAQPTTPDADVSKVEESQAVSTESKPVVISPLAERMRRDAEERERAKAIKEKARADHEAYKARKKAEKEARRAEMRETWGDFLDKMDAARKALAKPLGAKGEAAKERVAELKAAIKAEKDRIAAAIAESIGHRNQADIEKELADANRLCRESMADVFEAIEAAQKALADAQARKAELSQTDPNAIRAAELREELEQLRTTRQDALKAADTTTLDELKAELAEQDKVVREERRKVLTPEELAVLSADKK